MDARSILTALWLFLPAYVANMSPVFSAKLLPRWTRPIDNGRTHRDGRRILGDGKTWRGLAGGALAGGLTALALSYAAFGVFAEEDFGRGQGGHPVLIFIFGAVVGAMALIGDATESYFKRRSGRERGAPWIPFDQLDFVVFGLIGYIAAAPLLPGTWIFDHLLLDGLGMATILIGTVVLHLLVNRIGYWLGLKEVPW